MTKLPTLSVRKIIGQTLDYISANRAKLIDALKYPGIGLMITSFCQSFSLTKEEGIYSWVLVALQVYFFTIFAVRCHRLILLSESPLSLMETMKWGKRETGFLFYGFGLAGIFAIISIVPVFMSFPLLMKFSDIDAVVGKLVGYFFLLPGGYVVSRLSLVLPAAATDHKDYFQSAWDISAGNGWRLFVLVCLLPITIGPITNAIGDSSFPLCFISDALMLFFLLIEITVLSHIFKELTNSNYSREKDPERPRVRS